MFWCYMKVHHQTSYAMRRRSWFGHDRTMTRVSRHERWQVTACLLMQHGAVLRQEAILRRAKHRGGSRCAQIQLRNYDMMRPLPLAACLAIATTFIVATATAQQDDTAADPSASPAPEVAAVEAPAPVTGNLEAGRSLAYTCQGCHGIPGYKNAYPSFHVPKIGGQPQEYLVSALTGYKNGTRKHPTMEVQAQSFSEQDIADIAAFLSTLK